MSSNTAHFRNAWLGVARVGRTRRCDVTDKRSFNNNSFVPGGLCLGKPILDPMQGQPIYSAGGDPDLRHQKGLGINRKTWSWNAAAACFAYG
eukprot:SAG31_NODE_23841_length_494_cov_1.169620_1_plen_91_part_01